MNCRFFFDVVIVVFGFSFCRVLIRNRNIKLLEWVVLWNYLGGDDLLYIRFGYMGFFLVRMSLNVDEILL